MSKSPQERLAAIEILINILKGIQPRLQRFLNQNNDYLENMPWDYGHPRIRVIWIFAGRND